MSEETDLDKSSEVDESLKPVIKEEVNMQYHWYILVFLIIYYGSYVISGMILFGFIMFFFLPFFLEAPNFISLFIDLKSLLSLLFMPLIIIICYLIHLVLISLTTGIFWKISERISPSKDGIIPRNIRSKTANYYHLRSFIIKYGKRAFTKGIFPWLSNWFFNFIGASKIGKGTTIEESVGSDKFVDVGKNCYIGVNSTLASHLIQGIFGNIGYFRLHVGDNVTTAAMSQIGPGVEIYDNSFLLPLASCSKHSLIKGGKNYYFGIPLRKIFKKKTMEYLGLTQEDMDKNQNIDKYTQTDKKKKAEIEDEENIDIEEEFDTSTEEEIQEDIIDIDDLTVKDLALDFTTSSAISRINIKFLAVYLPIFWLAGLMVCIFWYEYTKGAQDGLKFSTILFLPIALLFMVYIFILGCLLFSKLLLILINLIHKPKEGIFLAQIRDTDYEFWMLRKELKKIVLWLLRNSPLPWIDVLGFRWFGLNIDFSSHLNDAWVDAEFVNFGRKVLIGQGATVMSSMVVGKYLIIKKVIFDDYVMVGGHTTIAPGTIIGNDGMIAAISNTIYDQVLEPAWVYFGIPGIKLRENRYAEERRDIIIKRDVDGAKKFEMEHEVNIDEDKKDLIKKSKEVKDK